jgi:hypothetical protein
MRSPLDRVLRTHIQHTEGPGGLFEDVLDRSPHLVHEVDGLRAEHAELLAELGAADEVPAIARRAFDAGAAEELIHALSSIVGKHFDREDNLVWRAYDLDLGGGG